MVVLVILLRLLQLGSQTHNQDKMGCGKSKEGGGGGKGDKQLNALTQASEKSGTEDVRDKYDIGEILGSGSFGQVRRAKLKDGSQTDVRAVKVIERDDDDGEWSNQAMFVREVELLQKIEHTNIIRYYDFYADPHFLYVVMELCSGGEVFQKILELKRFQESDAAAIGRQMLSALNYVHSSNIAHRDIKAENFLFSDSSITSPIKMIDFGMATKFKEGQILTELCGSPHYLSPELIGQKYTHLADLWAFGVLLYLLMYGRYPYDGKNPQDIMTKILTAKIEWRHDKAKLSEDAQNFIKALLERNPSKRLTAEQGLKHVWLQPKQPSKEATNEAMSIPTDVIRSAHKKATATKKQMDEKVEKLRNDKLMKINDDFTKGIRYGERLGPTPKESYQSKPEFVRRDNKLTTAPSRDINARKGSMDKMINKIKGNKIEEEGSGVVPHGASGNSTGGRDRSHSLTERPRRLSQMDGVTQADEKKLADMYKDLKEFSSSQGKE